MRKSLLLAFPLLALLATAAHAAPAAGATTFLRSLAAPAACATHLTAGASEALPRQIPAPQERTGAGCNAGFCQSDDDCPCDSAQGTCSGGTCHYGPSGGGGGGGGLGCPAALCFLDSQCVSNCKDAPNSYCGPGGLCVYVP